MLLTTDGKLARRRDIAPMNELLEITLTDEQQQFAEQHRATMGSYCTGNQAICLYRKQPRTTIRWIVDSYGYLLEATAFECAA